MTETKNDSRLKDGLWLEVSKEIGHKHHDNSVNAISYSTFSSDKSKRQIEPTRLNDLLRELHINIEKDACLRRYPQNNLTPDYRFNVLTNGIPDQYWPFGDDLPTVEDLLGSRIEIRTSRLVGDDDTTEGDRIAYFMISKKGNVKLHMVEKDGWKINPQVIYDTADKYLKND